MEIPVRSHARSILASPRTRSSGRPAIRSPSALASAIVLAGMLVSAVAPASAQQSALPAAPAAAPPATSAPAPSAASAGARAPAQPIALSEIAGQADAATAQLREVDQEVASDAEVTAAIEALAQLEPEVAALAAEVRTALARNPSLDTLRGLEAAWVEIERRATAITRDLTRRAAQLERLLTTVQALEATWSATLAQARAAGAPPEVIERTRELARAIGRTEAETTTRRTRVLALQARAAEVGGRITEARAAVSNAADRAASRLLSRDSPPLWVALPQSGPAAADRLLHPVEAAAGQLDVLRRHLEARWQDLALQVALAIGLVAALAWVRRRTGSAALPTAANHALRALDAPVSAGALLALFLSPWFHAQAPPVLWILLSLVGTIPTTAMLRRVLEPGLRPILYVLVSFFVFDQIRALLATDPSVARVLLSVQTIAGLAFAAWAQRRAARAAAGGVWTAVRRAARPIVVVLALAAVALTLGYVRLGELLASATLSSVYVGLALVALLRVARGLVAGLLGLRLFAARSSVQRRGALIERRLGRWLGWAAIGLWVLFALERFALRRPALDLVRDLWRAPIALGSLTLTIGDVLAFVLVLWAAWLVSRLLRFALEEEVFPNLPLGRGVPYAVTTLMHYVVLAVGFVLGVAALGVDMTRFTLLASAFGIGLGFGMQNIVNNFVSGLIVLFERPVKPGDLIQVDDTIGRVERIGIRACVVRLPTGAEVIMPNGKLIAERITNWTFTDRARQVQIPVTAAVSAEPDRVLRALVDAVRDHPAVAKAPAPDALLVKLGPDWNEYELRVWTERFDDWARVRSELVAAASAALRVAGITPR